MKVKNRNRIIFQEPYSTEVSKNLRLAGEQFREATGFAMKVAYLQSVLDPTESTPS